MDAMTADWPDDADGDVFCRLQAHGFIFAKPHTVDYNVDFDSWPPAEEVLARLAALVGAYEVVQPTDEADGYVRFHVTGSLTYQGVVHVQSEVTAAVAPFGGVCESWGVAQESQDRVQ